jgi:endonuclease YncB( thermonuclease family)
VHYPGNTSPSRHDDKFQQLAEWITQGKAPINDDLGAFLQPRLASGRAGTLQKEQGDQATAAFNALLDEKLTRPNSSRKRDLFLRAGDEKFDQYGRLLAYIAPNYTTEEREAMSLEERATFNLLLIVRGWAATFPIYPSLPKYEDLILLQQGAKKAFDDKIGVWSDTLTLTGYEFRMCYKLWDITRQLEQGKKLSSSVRNGWISRYCVDMTSRAIFLPQDYFRVPVFNRIFVWPKDVNSAVSHMNLEPGKV